MITQEINTIEDLNKCLNQTINNYKKGIITKEEHIDNLLYIRARSCFLQKKARNSYNKFKSDINR